MTQEKSLVQQLRTFDEEIPAGPLFAAVNDLGEARLFRLRDEAGRVRLYNFAGHLIADEYNSIYWLREEFMGWLSLEDLAAWEASYD